MKSKFVAISLILILIFGLMLTGCTDESKIYINGNVEETIEVNTTFTDSGVHCPNNFTVITDGQINTALLGRQTIKYYVYSADGELVKELHRYVNIVDTTSPVYTPIANKEYYAGIVYGIDDFVADYSDNYTNKNNITVSESSFVFTSVGEHQVNISFADSSNNVTIYSTSVNVQLDIEKLIDNVYKNQTYKVSKGTTGIGSNYIRVEIDSSRSLYYYDSGSLHYLQTVSTNLGTIASIQISANYGEFNSASVSYHISSALYNEYSVGFATIDATSSAVTVNQFNSTINNLNLDTNQMLQELNSNIMKVLNDFQTYMSTTLHLALK